MWIQTVLRTVRPLVFLLIVTFGYSASATAATQTHRPVAKHRVTKHNHHKLHQAGWAGAGFAAGQAAGPAGSATVGVAKYRHDLKAGGRRRTHAAAKIGAPIAAGAIAGPPGVAAYEAVDHRNWIKRHLFRRKTNN